MTSLYKSVLCATLFTGLALSSHAQQGTIRGKVTDGESGEVLLGATVRLLLDNDVTGGAYTDIEGSYSIKANPGTYSLVVSYVSFINDTIDNVTLSANQVVFNQSLLFQSLQVREDLAVEIVAKRNQASTVTLYNTKRNSINTIDGISLDLVKRTGDPNVAAAMQRVTGVTVEDGKYVYVRGLGDRYSKSLLNGAELPGLDPNRNTVQMDIFPSNLIDNILVYKTFTPDLPGDFTGGLIDVQTKDFPDRFTLSVSTSWGINDQSSFLGEGDMVPTQQTGNTDWLAYDDGTRGVPGTIQSGGIPAPTFDPNETATIDQITNASNSFETRMFPTFDGSTFMNHNHQISIGDQFELGGRPFGYIIGLSYRNSYSFFDGLADVQNANGNTTFGFSGSRQGRFKNTSSVGSITTDLNTEAEIADVTSTRNVLWGTLIKLSYKPRTAHKFSFNYMRNQSARTRNKFLQGTIASDDPGLGINSTVLGFLERSLDVFQLSGDHAFFEGKLKANWIVSLSESRQNEPDLRFYASSFEFTSSGNIFYELRDDLYNGPSRFYRDLEESNINAKLDFEIPISLSERDGKIKFGGAFTQKERDFRETRYEYLQGPGEFSFGANTLEESGDLFVRNAEAFFSRDNLGAEIQDLFGTQIVQYKTYLTDASEDRNIYRGEQDVLGVYAMTVLPITPKLKFQGGARLEITDASTVSQDSSVAQGLLDLTDVLPSANFIYALQDNMNLRFGYTRTLARPTFREFSPFVSFDFIQDFLLVGNPNLERTLIDNFDVRWEWYPTPGEVISVSGFYKDFDKPIEKVIEPRAGGSVQELTFRNVPSAEVLGVEIELRKDLDFLGPFFESFQLGLNASLIDSKVDINQQELDFIRSVDPERSANRPLYGQSPFAVNGELAYLNDSLGIKASVSYNIFGERISVVGGANPDVYEQPRGLLNVSVSKDLGNRWSARLRANNLLNPDYKHVQEYRGVEYIYQLFNVGRTYSLSFTYNIK
ncbi:MAG: TonB-dependent receptor [Bacteroidota bacterium]